MFFRLVLDALDLLDNNTVTRTPAMPPNPQRSVATDISQEGRATWIPVVID